MCVSASKLTPARAHSSALKPIGTAWRLHIIKLSYTLKQGDYIQTAFGVSQPFLNSSNTQKLSQIKPCVVAQILKTTSPVHV